jgi:hypothetical protein
LYTYIETAHEYGFLTRGALAVIANFTFVPAIFAKGSEIRVSQELAPQMHIKIKQGHFE